jgi:peptidoglycan DL-endopeptidase CwlO
MRSRSFCLLTASVWLIAIGSVQALPEQDESFGDKVKEFFAQPTPTPRKKHKASPSPSSKKKTTPKPSPSARPKPSASPTATATPSPLPTGTSSPAATPLPSQTPEETPRHRRLLSEPVRAISPGPRHRHVESPPPGVKISSPAETEPAHDETPRSAPSLSPGAASSPAVGGEEKGKGKGTRGPVATIAASEIGGYDNYAPGVRKILDRALSLTTQNLGYKYGSADPANGGMDCSGFIHYVLSQSGMADVPRDAREQYIWVRKAGTFRAVLGHSDDSFELDELKPGDLLFWSGTYHTDRDPDITHTMIYLGREKGSNQRVMVGSSDGRTYKGQSRFGVSVFDFKVPARKAPKPDEGAGPVFVGYGRIPGRDETH